jgi:hypothetical protein
MVLATYGCIVAAVAAMLAGYFVAPIPPPWLVINSLPFLSPFQISSPLHHLRLARLANEI